MNEVSGRHKEGASRSAGALTEINKGRLVSQAESLENNGNLPAVGADGVRPKVELGV